VSDKSVIVGICSGIKEKPSGWFDLEIQVPGKQYPVRLETKLEKLVDEARETHGKTATWTFVEKEGNINPRSGNPYINRYLDRVEIGDHAPVATAEAGPQQHHDALHYADKDRAISRMACLKAAAAIHSGDEPGEGRADAVLKDAERFEAWLYRDLQSDDDIPF
jgi:hypothetical protein